MQSIQAGCYSFPSNLVDSYETTLLEIWNVSMSTTQNIGIYAY